MAKFAPKPVPAPTPAAAPVVAATRPDPDAIRSGMEQVRGNFDLFRLAQRLVAQSGGVNEAIALVELVPLLNEVAAAMSAGDE